MPTGLYARGYRSWANGGTTPTASGTFTATAVPSTGRVTLAISWTGAAYLNVYRVVGSEVFQVRGGSPIGSTGSVTFSDPEAPLDVPVYYQATSPTYQYQWLTSNTVTLASNGSSWLTHPNRPDLSTVLWVERNPRKSRPISRGVFPVLGRRRPIIRTDGARKSPSYQLDCATETQSAWTNMLALLDDGSPLLLRTPPNYGFDALTWLSVGDVDEDPVVGTVTNWVRRWPLPVTEVDPPSILDAPVVP